MPIDTLQTATRRELTIKEKQMVDKITRFMGEEEVNPVTIECTRYFIEIMLASDTN